MNNCPFCNKKIVIDGDYAEVCDKILAITPLGAYRHYILMDDNTVYIYYSDFFIINLPYNGEGIINFYNSNKWYVIDLNKIFTYSYYELEKRIRKILIFL